MSFGLPKHLQKKVDKEIKRGDIVNLEIKGDVSSVTLISTGSITHAQASEAKFRQVDFTKVLDNKIQIKLDKNPNLTVADLIEEQVDKNPSLIALEYEDKKYTYQQLDQESNKVANWAIDKGYKYGDVISLLMENKPEFLFAFV